MQGWVSFHRQITEWEWYTDPNTFRLFFHLVLMANNSDGNWRGVAVKRGQHITSVKKLAEALNLSEKQIRTSLDKLKSTKEITTLGANKYTIVTIEKYALYQDDDKKKASKQANKGQSKGEQRATNNNEDTDDNENKKEYSDLSEFAKLYPGKKIKDVREKKLPALIKKYGYDQMIRTVQRYAKEVYGKKDFILNESTFWNGRYIDYLDDAESKPVEVKPVRLVEKSYEEGLKAYDKKQG